MSRLIYSFSSIVQCFVIFVLRNAALFTVEEGTVLTFDTDRGIHVQGNVKINMYYR